MTKKELMNLGITDEQADGVLDLLKDAYVPLYRFNEINEKMKSYKTQAEEKAEEVKTLSAKVGDTEKLKSQIETLKSENTNANNNHMTEIASLKRDYAIEGKVRDRKAKNVKAVMALIDKEKITFENGVYGGIDEQLDALVEREDSKFMFESTPTYVPKGTKPGENSGGHTSTGATSFVDAIKAAIGGANNK